MKEIYPSYYDEFQCIADRCEDTCCAGWEIDIDDETYESYRRVGGDLGARLRACIKTYEKGEEGYDEVYEQHGFVLTEEMRCPFLDEHNLCDIYRELGEDALCEVCTNTPRNFLEYVAGRDVSSSCEQVREITVSASCPEAARLIYGSPGSISFIEKEDEKSDEDIELTDDLREEATFGHFLQGVRREAIRILQDRERSLSDRIRDFLRHSEEVQECINCWEAGEKDLPEVVRVSSSTDRLVGSVSSAYRHFLIRMGSYSGLASIGSAWKDKMESLYQSFIGDGEEGNNDFQSLYIETTDNLKKHLTENGRLYEYEHLLVYYTFLLMNRSIDDYDYLGKAKLVVLSYLMNRDMDAVVFLQKGSLSAEDRQENARIYAREVEHAEENLADLAEEILFERAYDVEGLGAVV